MNKPTHSPARISAALAASGISITRVVEGYRYARNGNAHNPTPELRFDVFCRGRLVGYSPRLREAKDIAVSFLADPEW